MSGSPREAHRSLTATESQQGVVSVRLGFSAAQHFYTAPGQLWTPLAALVLVSLLLFVSVGLAGMPAFGGSYSDNEVAAVANYVTARFGAKGSSLDARNVELLRAQSVR